MKKFVFAVVVVLLCKSAYAQTIDTTKVIAPPPAQTTQTPATIKMSDLSSRSNDHLMLQYGFDGWSGNPDSINPQGFSRHFNLYIMLDKPFKTNPHFSVGIGIGVGSSNIFFERTYVDIKSTSARLPFQRLDSLNHFKKFKLTTVYAEAPVELRFSSNPMDDGKSFKAALGVKVGTIVNAHTKGKTFEDKNGNTINNYIQKENTRNFFNTTRLSATARVGYGIISLHGSYQVTALLKDGAGPAIRPYSIGLAISGL